MADGSLYDILITLANEAFYAPGDGVTFGNEYGGVQFAGLVTASTKEARFTIHVGKSLANIDTITVTHCEGGVRTPSGGYMNSVMDNGDWFNQSNVTVSATKMTDYVIMLAFTSTVAFTNVSNNQCLVFNASPLVLEFS